MSMDTGPAPSQSDVRLEYLDPDIASNYESVRFSGRLGSYVWRREQRGVGRIVGEVGNAKRILDCPSGIGRWQPMLDLLNPELIVEADFSPAMLDAGGRYGMDRWPRVRTDAELLPFGSASFDLVFSHALTKHLPLAAQARVLAELARVSSRYVVCSFSLRQGMPGIIRRVRHAGGSFAVSQHWLAASASASGLRLVVSAPCTTPIGVERSVLFEKIERGPLITA
jgi:ubiquinone/menaquinone biosynthesis C-methylase UbiE